MYECFTSMKLQILQLRINCLQVSISKQLFKLTIKGFLNFFLQAYASYYFIISNILLECFKKQIIVLIRGVLKGFKKTWQTYRI